MVGFSKKRSKVQAQASAVSEPNERLPLGVSLSLSISPYIFPFGNIDNYEPEKSRQQRADVLSSFIRPHRNSLCQSIPTDHISQRAVRWLLSKAALPLPTMWIKLHFTPSWIQILFWMSHQRECQYLPHPTAMSYFQNLYLLNTPALSIFNLLVYVLFYLLMFHNSTDQSNQFSSIQQVKSFLAFLFMNIP